MKVKIKTKKGPKIEVCTIREEYIRLDALLKFTMLAETGGEAKLMIQEGEVTVNGEVCTQRGKKIRPGDIVRCGGSLYTVKQAVEQNAD